VKVRAEAEVFRRIPLFAECDWAQLQVLAFSCDREEFAEGEAIVKQGSKGDAAYLILKGRAEVVVTSGGATRPVAAVESGAFIGELAMIAGLPYSITAVAAAAVTAARVPRSLFMRVAEEFPDFGAKVFAAMARKLDGSVNDLLSVQRAFDEARSFAKR
jgi:CRP/FNR family transcriptional regulator, cyclic AMP receptor protein